MGSVPVWATLACWVAQSQPPPLSVLPRAYSQVDLTLGGVRWMPWGTWIKPISYPPEDKVPTAWHRQPAGGGESPYCTIFPRVKAVGPGLLPPAGCTPTRLCGYQMTDLGGGTEALPAGWDEFHGIGLKCMCS